MKKKGGGHSHDNKLQKTTYVVSHHAYKIFSIPLLDIMENIGYTMNI